MTDSTRLGPVQALYRYPVKSLRGEDQDAIQVEVRGVAGDRLYALRNPEGKFGSGKSTRRFRKMDSLLDLQAAFVSEKPVITFPDGRVVAGDDPDIHDHLSAYVGQPITLAREDAVSHFDDSPLHLITTAGLRTLGLTLKDAQRFRPNVVIDVPGYGFVEDSWIGRDLELGGVRLHVTGGAVRCVMIGMAQEQLPEQPQLLRRVADLHDTCFGVYATVVTPGTVQLGAEVRLV